MHIGGVGPHDVLAIGAMLANKVVKHPEMSFDSSVVHFTASATGPGEQTCKQSTNQAIRQATHVEIDNNVNQ